MCIVMYVVVVVEVMNDYKDSVVQQRKEAPDDFVRGASKNDTKLSEKLAIWFPFLENVIVCV